MYYEKKLCIYNETDIIQDDSRSFKINMQIADYIFKLVYEIK